VRHAFINYSIIAFARFFNSQISDSVAELLPQSVDPDNKYVGFDGKGTPSLQAFLNGGFLLKKNLGVDLRVVSVASQTLKFQWKTNLQKVRGRVAEPAWLLAFLRNSHTSPPLPT
jgi:hypothetical protein